MIPDHIMGKAIQAAADNWVMAFEWEHDKLYAQVHAALEAVAADIWDDAYWQGNADGRWDDLTTNPYRKAGK